MVSPFNFSFGQQITTPQQVERNRLLAAALSNRPVAQNVGQGLAALAGGFSASQLNNRADAAEQAGMDSVASALSGLGPNADFSTISSALSNPWISQSPGGSAIAQTLMNQNLQRSDPSYQLDMAYKQAQIDALGRKDAQSPYLNVGGGAVFNTGTGEFMAAPNGGDLPNDVKEYNWYAESERAAGREPLAYIDFINAQKGAGLSVTTGPDGTTTVTQGGPGTKLTEGQSKDVVYYTRGIDANKMLNGNEEKLTDWGQENAGKIPLGLGNYVREPEFRQAKIAADAFLTAILRKDTGAAITDQEFEIYGPIFLPVPGDDPQTIQTKRRMRDVALLAIKGGLGTADAIAKANAEVLGVDTEAPIRPAGTSGQQPTQPSGDVVDWTDYFNGN